LAPFFYAEFKAREWRWWLSGIRFGTVRVESTLPHAALYGLYWKVIGWYLLLSSATGAYFGLCAFLATKLSGGNVAAAAAGGAAMIPLLIMVGIGYLALLLSINVVMRLYLQRDVWVKVSGSLQVHGIEAAANVAAIGDPASALGEGFADGLDVAGF
jgi:uncharacterized membrane protein YjgN (DUF898 family)